MDRMDLCYYHQDDKENKEEWSSGCDSGWTLYFQEQQPYSSPMNHTNNILHRHFHPTQDQDLSMLSDASSGPPHFLQEEDDDDEDEGSPLPVKKKPRPENPRLRFTNDHIHSSLLDDTASSPFFHFSSKTRSDCIEETESVVDYSQGFSTTQFNHRPPCEKDYGILRSPSSESYRLQHHQVLFEEKSFL